MNLVSIGERVFWLVMYRAYPLPGGVSKIGGRGNRRELCSFSLMFACSCIVRI
jgi:hypothetical protein